MCSMYDVEWRKAKAKVAERGFREHHSKAPEDVITNDRGHVYTSEPDLIGRITSVKILYSSVKARVKRIWDGPKRLIETT